MTRFISVFQPLGNAASELRKIVPFIGHNDAVTSLQCAEATGRYCLGAGYTVTFKRHEGWTVEAP